MIDTVITIIICFALMVCLPVGILLVRDRLRRPTKQEMSEHSKRFIDRLKNPDLKAIEDHFRHQLPSSLIALYNNQNEILRSCFYVAEPSHVAECEKWYIAFYMPADIESARDAWPELKEYFEFADDGCGNGYIVDPTQTDPAVLFHDHETGEIIQVCNSLSEFMRWSKIESQ